MFHQQCVIACSIVCSSMSWTVTSVIATTIRSRRTRGRPKGDRQVGRVAARGRVVKRRRRSPKCRLQASANKPSPHQPNRSPVPRVGLPGTRHLRAANAERHPPWHLCAAGELGAETGSLGSLGTGGLPGLGGCLEGGGQLDLPALLEASLPLIDLEQFADLVCVAPATPPHVSAHEPSRSNLATGRWLTRRHAPSNVRCGMSTTGATEAYTG